MTKLRLAGDLALPVDAVTQTFLIVGKRGSGKSNTAARFVEQLHHAGLPFVVLDPVDTWWGLKAGLAGGPGLNVYVFGGAHADLPLQAGDGGLLAEVLCEHRMPMVLSVKHLSGRARSDFMVAFAQTLFQKWAGGPLHLVLEEAHELAPQSAQHGREGEQQMLGAFKRLWKLGRASGIGGSAITQRPASLSKDITTQSEILIAHRTIGPQDVKAVGEWVKYHGERLDMLAELPSLPTGEAFVWAPEFPEGKAIGLTRSKILLRETYDSASTPKVGERRVEPKQLAPVDLERLRAKMSVTIEKAKADDPKLLRARIAELERAAKATPAKTVEKPVVDQGAVDRAAAAAFDRGRRVMLESALAAVKPVRDALFNVEGKIVDALQRAYKEIKVEWPAPVPASASIDRSKSENRPTPAPRPRWETNGHGTLSRGQQKIVNALAELVAIGVDEPSRTQLGLYAGYNLTGGSGAQHIADLVVLGLAEIPANGVVRLTVSGLGAADAVSAPRSLDDLHQRVRAKLSSGQVRILDHLISIHPEPISRADLGAAVGYNLTGGSGAQHVADLVSVGAVTIPRTGSVVASDLLFPAGLR